ncbi:MAG: hypothetical protein FWB72_02480 [Firmicutes bacterium]|nr:hypothetical protein [Bacillota bacterium]
MEINNLLQNSVLAFQKELNDIKMRLDYIEADNKRFKRVLGGSASGASLSPLAMASSGVVSGGKASSGVARKGEVGGGAVNSGESKP